MRELMPKKLTPTARYLSAVDWTFMQLSFQAFFNPLTSHISLGGQGGVRVSFYDLLKLKSRMAFYDPPQ